MVPNGSHPVAPFAMNQNGDASLGMNQNIAQDQSFNIQAQRLQQSLPPLLQQNSLNQWQQTQLAVSANQQLPTLNMLPFGQLSWTNQMSNPQQIQNMLHMAPFNMPLISQQLIQEACSMSQPVDAADEPILLTALLKAKKSERNFKEALNGLHGVITIRSPLQPVTDFLLNRPMAIQLACGKTTTWNIKTVLTIGSKCV